MYLTQFLPYFDNEKGMTCETLQATGQLKLATIRLDLTRFFLYIPHNNRSMYSASTHALATKARV